VCGGRECVAVWDGPNIRIRDEDGAIGLIDLGHASWQPLVNVVANRSLNGPDQGVSSLPRFLDSLQAELSLTTDELEAMDTFRRHNAGIYARWAANRVVEHGETSLVGWLESLARFLRS
jgi:Ser/Thr protein kinase RdoA (MazF antagonist)